MPPDQIPCPSCKRLIPVFAEESRWCSHCEWNLFPSGDVKKNDATQFQTYYKEAARKYSDSVFQSFKNSGLQKSSFNTSKLITLMYVTLVHSLVVILVVLAISVFYVMTLPLAIIHCLLFLALTWMTMPKPRKFEHAVVPKAKAPHLYKLADQIADLLPAPRITDLVLGTEFKSSYDEHGIWPFKRRVLTLGVPLAKTLTDEEIIAVLCQEISHGIAGDLTRRFYIDSAMRTLTTWRHILTPKSLNEGAGYGPLYYNVIGNIIGNFLGKLPLLSYHFLAPHLLRQNQEATYIGDLRASKVCGTLAFQSMLLRSARSGPHLLAVSKAALSNGKVDFFQQLQENYGPIPSTHDNERLRRLGIRQGLEAETGRAPTAYRIEILNSVPAIPSQIVLSSTQSAELRTELQSFCEQIGAKIVDDYRNSLYSH